MSDELILSTNKPKDLKILKLWCLLELPFEFRRAGNNWEEYKGTFARALRHIANNEVDRNIQVKLRKSE